MLPIFEKPGWCLSTDKIDRDSNKGYWFCEDENGYIASSGLPKLPANATNLTYIGCLVVLWYYIKARDYYRKRDTTGDTVNVQLWLIAIAIVNLVVTVIAFNIMPEDRRDDNKFTRSLVYPYIDAFIRPVLGTLTARSVKSFWRRYLTVIKGSLPMVIFILIYVFYFAWMGNRLFAGTIEGVENFSGLNDSFFFMFVLLTTSNFPDIMLPSYGQARHFSVFFITFLVIGLFLFMNLLLAIFYSNYQERVEASMDRFTDTRNRYMISLFRKYDSGGKGRMNKEGVRGLIDEIHALVEGLDQKPEHTD